MGVNPTSEALGQPYTAAGIGQMPPPPRISTPQAMAETAQFGQPYAPGTAPTQVEQQFSDLLSRTQVSVALPQANYPAPKLSTAVMDPQARLAMRQDRPANVYQHHGAIEGPETSGEGYQALDFNRPSERLGIPEEVPDDYSLQDIILAMNRIRADYNRRQRQFDINETPAIERHRGLIAQYQQRLATLQGPYDEAKNASKQKANGLRVLLEAENKKRNDAIDEEIAITIGDEIAKLSRTDLQRMMYAPDTEARVRTFAEQYKRAPWAQQYNEILTEINNEEAQSNRNAEVTYGSPIKDLKEFIEQRTSELAVLEGNLEAAKGRDAQQCFALFKKYRDAYKAIVAVKEQYGELCKREDRRAAKERRAFLKVHGSTLAKAKGAAIAPGHGPSRGPLPSQPKSKPPLRTGQNDRQAWPNMLALESGERRRRPSRRRVLAFAGGAAVVLATVGGYVASGGSNSEETSASLEGEAIPSQVVMLDSTIKAYMSNTSLAARVNKDGKVDTYNVMDGTGYHSDPRDDDPRRTYDGFLEAIMAETSAGNPNYKCENGPQVGGNPEMICGVLPMPKQAAMDIASRLNLKLNPDGGNKPEVVIPVAISYFNKTAVSLLGDKQHASRYSQDPKVQHVSTQKEAADIAAKNFNEDILKQWGITAKNNPQLADKIVTLALSLGG